MNRNRHDRQAHPRTPLRQLAVGTVATLGVALVLSSSSRPLQEGGPDVDGTRAALEKYVEVRSLISKEQRDWALERGLLESRVELIQSEIEQFRERIAETESSIGESDRTRQDFRTKRDGLEATSAGLAEIVAELEARVRALVDRLPEPALERVSLLSQQIPADPGKTDLALGRRFQNVIGVLDQLNRFNREIRVFSELVVNSNGIEVEASTVHVGLGRAFYVSGDYAGFGPASAEPGAPWEWEARNDKRAEIAMAVAILNSMQPADFVQLPIPTDIPTE